MSIALIWAQSADRVIGVDGGMPWHLPEDMAHFRTLTAGSVVVMGHTTWRSLPVRFRPLPGRENLVLSRRTDLVLDGATVLGGVQEVLDHVGERDVWVIGGAQVYEAVLDQADRAEVTEIDIVLGSGTRAPELDDTWTAVGTEPAEGWAVSSTGLRYRFAGLLRSGRPGQGVHGRR